MGAFKLLSADTIDFAYLDFFLNFSNTKNNYCILGIKHALNKKYNWISVTSQDNLT